MSAVDVVQEIVEITVDSGAVKSVLPIRKKGVTRTEARKTVRLAAASGSQVRVAGDARLEFVQDGKKRNMKFLDADVRRPLASVIANVGEGNIVVFELQESYIENTSIGQKRNDVFVAQLDAQADSRTTKNVSFDETQRELTSGQREPECRRNSGTL